MEVKKKCIELNEEPDTETPQQKKYGGETSKQ
jgi:hypothetical protein